MLLYCLTIIGMLEKLLNRLSRANGRFVNLYIFGCVRRHISAQKKGKHPHIPRSDLDLGISRKLEMPDQREQGGFDSAARKRWHSVQHQDDHRSAPRNSL